MHVEDVRADHNSGYGIAAFVSTRSVFEDNRASYNGEAGLYRGDSPNADSLIRDNSADHNGIGVFMRDSTELTATDNTVWDNCVGVLALWTGGEAPGDIPAGDYRISDNTANDNTMACPGGEHPPLSGMGIALAGVHDTLVSDNEVHGNHPTGPTIAAGGVVIFSTKFIGGADPTNNRVRDNELSHNQPADIVWDGSGSGNKVRDNDCVTAIPANLGWCHGDHN
jgi:nitrous oxidase accessory protein NosD